MTRSTVYLDNGATTQTDPRVAEAMARYLVEFYGNPSSSHALGAASKSAVDTARRVIADSVGANPNKVYFTSGGTEADTLGIRGAVPDRPGNVVMTNIEHPAVLNQRDYLESRGHEVRIVDVGADGVVAASDVLAATDRDTHVVAVMAANNEIGTLQPVAEIGRALRDGGGRARLFVDGVQAYTKFPFDLESMGIDLLAISAHKIHGPPGVGALIQGSRGRVLPQLAGGGQEAGVRPGTENVPGIVGFGVAVSVALDNEVRDGKTMAGLRDRLIAEALRLDPAAQVNGHRTERLCNNASIAFSNMRGSTLLGLLEEEGVYASAGSACHAGNTKQSAVLSAIGVPESTGTIRFTLSRYTTEEEVERACVSLGLALARARTFLGGA